MSYAPEQLAPLHDARVAPDTLHTPAAASANPHIVIVGGGFAGLEVARGLRHARLRVTVIDRANHHLFQPLLYQVATAELSAGEIAQPIRHILRDCANATVLMGEMTSVDPLARRVTLADGGSFAYDRLVLATGATHGYFGHPEWAKHAPGLKTLEDARRIRDRLLLAFEAAERSDDEAERRRLLTIAVIGGGPTGVEMAGAIAELARRTLKHEFRRIDPRATRILLFEAGPRLLPQFPEDLSQYATRALQRLGVEVRCGAAVADIVADAIAVGDERLPTGAVVWAAGVALPPLGRWLGAATDKAGRIVVDPTMAVPGHPDIFVLGDAACFTDGNGQVLPGLAQVAHQQGRHLGRALARHFSDGRPLAPFRYRSRGNLATIGRNAAVTHFDRLKLRGFPAWVIWSIVHVFLLIGFENRLLVTIRWLWAYVTAQRSARLIIDGGSGRAP